ncbi:MAG TPA: aldo/keto reductase, partial [Isosphaeraceae bacterium]|nr:aldo/keto reductase [Isosphaeraceae bacterium]
GSYGGSRRQFLKTTAATGVALSAAESVLANAPETPLPTITLGKTGQVVTRLGMGSSWTVQAGFVQAAIFGGVRYVDTAKGYEQGESEKTIGEVIERTGKRKELYLVTKTHSPYPRQKDPSVFEKDLDGSLKRLRTDYVDAFFMHGLQGNQIPSLFDPEVKAAFEALKKSGKIRFCGLSCHDRQLVEIVEAAAKCGWLDQIMIQFNFRTMNADNLRRAVDAASKANLGLVAMKTQGGAGNFEIKDGDLEKFPKLAETVAKGFNKHQAAIKAVLADERINVVVSEMTNRDQLRDNMGAVQTPITAKEARLLEEHRAKTANLYCHGCGHLCETAAKGVPVATVLRYLRYYQVYGKRQQARALYQALPAEARQLASADLEAAEKACPYGLPVASLVQIADKRLG